MAWAGAGPCRMLLGAVLAIPLLAVPAGAQRPPAQTGVELPATAVRQIEETGNVAMALTNDPPPPAVTTCSGGMAGTYPCSNVDLMSFLALADIGGGEANDIWGWTDSSTGKEYAIMGRTNGTSFVDISDPVNPIYLGNLPPHSANSTWREIKVYADHAFVVTEANNSGMQVFDLTQLRSVASPPATFSETAHYSGFLDAHNLAINEDSGFAHAAGTNDCGGGLHMIDIQTPTSPTSAGCFSDDGYTHDAQCVNYDGPDPDHQGKEICFNSNVDTLTIVDVTNKASPAMLSRTGYSGSRYAHQGWLTEDHAYFLLGDELDETNNPDVTNTRTYMWDVSDLDGPDLIGFHDSTTTATDHNQYVKGSYTYQSNYQAGLRILDITDIANGNLSEAAFFDVYPGGDSTTFNGSWSNYPFFDSGIVIVSGIEQGMFILRPNLVDGVNPALASAAVNGAALTLIYGEVLDGSSTPAAGDFTVTVAGSGRTVTQVSVSGRGVTLTLNPAVEHGETGIAVSYGPGTNPIQDAAGNDAAELSNEPVTNNTVGTQPPPPPPPPPTTGGGGGGGGGGGRPPSYPGTIRAEGGDGEVTLTWDAPASRGSSRIQHYEYRIDGEGEWISTGSTGRTHAITGLIAGRIYFFHLRAVSAAGAGAHRLSPEATPVADLDFTHFANGGFITSTLALVNAGAYSVRPAIYFYDQDGDPIEARRVVDLTPDLEVADDGALRPRTVMNPLEELTIASHGRGGQRVGSVTVRAPGSIGGVLRFDIPNLGVAGVGDSPTVRDALLPVRRQAMGINTGVAVRNRGTATLTLQCRLMRDGAVVEEADIPLAANGQDSRFIDQVFPAADTSDFAGSVRCAAPEPGRFSAVAFELDRVHRVFTTLPVVPVPAVLEQEQEQEEEQDREQEEEQQQDATRLDFTHFANGGKIVSSLVLVNAGADPIRPAIHFHDQDGDAIPAESLVDITEDLEVDHHGALRPGAAMNPLGELTISTHGRGVLKVGSVAVTADGPIGGVLRFDIPGFGVAGVGDSPPVRDALVPVRRQTDGINTGVAVHNRGTAALLVRCRLMQDGAVLEETMIPLAANGQDSRFIDQVFPIADTSDFAGSVRCMTPEPGLFSAVAFELDAVNRIFTTLPVVPVVDVE